LIAERPAEVSQPALNFRVSALLRIGCRGLDSRRVAHARQIRFPGGSCGCVIARRRRRMQPHAEVESERRDRAQIIREQLAVLGVEGEQALAHGQVLVPTAELHVGAGQRIVTANDRRVARRRDRRVKKVEDVRHGWPEALDFQGIDAADLRQDLLFGVAAHACIQQAPEGALIGGILVDVRNAQLGLPQEGVVGAFERLPLLGDRVHHGLERGAAIRDTKSIGGDLGGDLLHAAANRAKVLQTVFPQEPALISPPRICPPPHEQFLHQGLRHEPSSPGRTIELTVRDRADALPKQSNHPSVAEAFCSRLRLEYSVRNFAGTTAARVCMAIGNAAA
jgi:hypothetical protein